MSERGTYHKGDTVTEESDYVCVPCGFKKHYQPGEIFTECTSCLSGTEDGHEDYVEGLGLWEKFQPTAKE